MTGSAGPTTGNGPSSTTEQAKEKAQEGAQQARRTVRDQVDQRSSEAGERVGSTAQDIRYSWSCDCGQVYLVLGTDRHRVYWLSDAEQSDPLLVRECVSCGAELPAGHDAALV